MTAVTIAQPSVGLQAYFEFKDPVAGTLRTSMTLPQNAAMLRVSSVITVTELQATSSADVFDFVYAPLGISADAFKDDLAEDVVILTLRYEIAPDKSRFLRVPLSFVQGYGNAGDIPYVNKHWVIDLGHLPSGIDTTIHFEDLKDFILTRLGIQCLPREVSTGEALQVEQAEHDIRESIRANIALVRPSLTTQLETLQHQYSQVMLRLQQLGVSLG